MKGKYTVFIILAVILIAIGATFYFVMQFFENNPTQPQPTGYRTGVIVEMKDNSILVVSNLSEEEARNLSVEEAMDTGKDATWFSLTMDQRNQLKLYDEVKVGYEGLNESFPAQGSAKTVEKLNE
ncbi:YobA family protein [Psychrobacillus sp. L4]|uniref:YobA family protein n=1 Tax=Psychrobacillus sp. L4 TaxID=3236892 RepID=UPI0036F3F4A2